MLEPTALLAFSLTALLFAASLGSNFVFVLTRTVGYGRAEGFASVLGICTGSLVYTLAAVLGLSALLASSALAFNTVKYAGAAYLNLSSELFPCQGREYSTSGIQKPLKRWYFTLF